MAGAVTAGCAEPVAAPPGRMPLHAELTTAGRDVVVVLSDTHRLDHVSAYDDAGVETPNLERLARDGVRFTRATTVAPISAPAYATLLTGLLPAAHGVLNNGQRLAGGERLAARLRAAGYETAAFVSNPFCSAAHGFGEGFDVFWDEIEGRGKEGEHVTDAALAWLENRAPDRPLFLFLAYMDAHTPYLSDVVPPSLRIDLNGEIRATLRAENAHVENRVPLRLAPGRNTVTFRFLDAHEPARPPAAPSPLYVTGLAVGDLAYRLETGWEEIPGERYLRLANRARLTVENPRDEPVEAALRFRAYRRYAPEETPRFYRGGVREVDRQLGRLRSELESRGRWDGAAVIFVSDHGEMLGEHGLWGHVDSLYEESLRVPLIVKAPGLPAGAVWDGRFDLRDLHDLILTLATGAVPAAPMPAAPVPAAPRFPFRDPEDAGAAAATYPPEAETLRVAVYDGPLKLLASGEGAALYDLEADPGETEDLLPARRDEPPVREMLARLSALRRESREARSLDPGTLSPEERDRLRALGYLR